MKHRRGFNPLSRDSAHRKALHRSMVTSLFRHERIKTTRAKALEVRRTAERLITRAKVDSVHNRRIASARLYDEGIVAKLFTDIALRMKERPGGYTRVLKLGERFGDAAEMVILELVDYKLELEDSGKKGKKAREDKDGGDQGAKKEAGGKAAGRSSEPKAKAESAKGGKAAQRSKAAKRGSAATSS